MASENGIPFTDGLRDLLAEPSPCQSQQVDVESFTRLRKGLRWSLPDIVSVSGSSSSQIQSFRKRTALSAPSHLAMTPCSAPLSSRALKSSICRSVSSGLALASLSRAASLPCVGVCSEETEREKREKLRLPNEAKPVIEGCSLLTDLQRAADRIVFNAALEDEAYASINHESRRHK